MHIPNPHLCRCLEEHLEDSAMSQECKAETTKDMNRMATDYRLNYRLNRACEGDVNRLCRNLCSTTGGQTCGGLVLQCLQVRALLGAQPPRRSFLFARRFPHCVRRRTIACPPRRVRARAQESQENITSQACQDEVFYYQLMEVTDFRNDVILAEACRNDVEAHCKDVEPGAADARCGRGGAARSTFGTPGT